jgi:hypothetical protein
MDACKSAASTVLYPAGLGTACFDVQAWHCPSILCKCLSGRDTRNGHGVQARAWSQQLQRHAAPHLHMLKTLRNALLDAEPGRMRAALGLISNEAAAGSHFCTPASQRCVQELISSMICLCRSPQLSPTPLGSGCRGVVFLLALRGLAYCIAQLRRLPLEQQGRHAQPSAVSLQNLPATPESRVPVGSQDGALVPRTPDSRLSCSIRGPGHVCLRRILGARSRATCNCRRHMVVSVFGEYQGSVHFSYRL